MNSKYIGNESQLYGVEEYRLVGGKGDGMRLLHIRNNNGLVFDVSLDRCADISRISLKGDNLSYFAPCGYVSPKYYDCVGAGFLKSFTAGFITTCGLTAVGSPCNDDGEELPLHGTISNTPCENFSYSVDDDSIIIKATIRDAALFAHKLILEREYVCKLNENVIYMTDTVKNIGSTKTPFEILYHCNIGYPLLSEKAELSIPSTNVAPRDEHAKEGIENCTRMEPPQSDYIEKCYYHTMSGEPVVSIYNGSIKKGINLKYDTNELKCFTEWKMMGEQEYVLGLEPGNCLPDGRNVMREKGILEFLNPGEARTIHLKFEFVEN